jgi:hypothetical protein
MQTAFCLIQHPAIKTSLKNNARFSLLHFVFKEFIKVVDAF